MKIKTIRRKIESAMKFIEDSYFRGTSRFNRAEIAFSVKIAKSGNKKVYDKFQMMLTKGLKQAGFIITKSPGERISPFINIKRTIKQKYNSIKSETPSPKWECELTDFEIEAFKDYKRTPGPGALYQFKETLHICNISEAMRRLGRLYHYESKIKQ